MTTLEHHLPLTSCHALASLLLQTTDRTDRSCVGTFGVSGTGPWVFEKKVTNLREIGPKEASLPSGQVNATLGEKLLEMHFTRNTKHWDTKAGE